MSSCISAGATAAARKAAIIHSPGRFSFERGALQASGALTNAFATSRRLK